MNKLKVVYLFISFLLLFLFSEILYVSKKNDLLSMYSIKLSEELSYSGMTKASFEVLKFTSLLTTNNYREINTFYDVLTSKNGNIDVDNNFLSILQEYLKKLPKDSNTLLNNYDLTRVFYELSMLAYKNGKSDFTIPLLEISINSNPTLSFPVVELANYYLHNGDKTSSYNILNKCLEIRSARQHCFEYLNTNFNLGAESVGFLYNTQKAYYDSDAP